MEKDVALMDRVSHVEAEVGKQGVRLDNVETRLTSVENETKDIHRLATAIELISHDTANTTAAVTEMRADMKEQISGLKDGQDRIEERVTNIETEPAKKTASKVEDIKDKLLWLFIGGLAMWLFIELLPNIFSK